MSNGLVILLVHSVSRPRYAKECIACVSTGGGVGLQLTAVIVELNGLQFSGDHTQSV